MSETNKHLQQAANALANRIIDLLNVELKAAQDKPEAAAIFLVALSIASGSVIRGVSSEGGMEEVIEDFIHNLNGVAHDGDDASPLEAEEGSVQ